MLFQALLSNLNNFSITELHILHVELFNFFKAFGVAITSGQPDIILEVMQSTG